MKELLSIIGPFLRQETNPSGALRSSWYR